MRIEEIEFKVPRNINSLNSKEFSFGLTRAYLYMTGAYVPGLAKNGYDFFSANPKRANQNLEIPERKKLNSDQFINTIPVMMDILTACLKTQHPSLTTTFSISYFQLRATYKIDLLTEECNFLKLLYNSDYDHHQHLVRVLVYIGITKSIIKTRSDEAKYFWIYDDICEKYTKKIDLLLIDMRKNTRKANFIVSGNYSSNMQINTFANIISSTIASATASNEKLVTDATSCHIPSLIQV